MARFRRRRFRGRSRRRSRSRPTRWRFARQSIHPSRRQMGFLRNLAMASEKKILSYSVNSAFPGSSGFLYDTLLDMQQGSNRGERIGNKVFIRYIKLRMRIVNGNSQTDYFRVALVWPRTDGLLLTDCPTSFNQFWNLQLVTVLWERSYSLGTSSAPSQTTTNNTQSRDRIINLTKKVWKTMKYAVSGLTSPVNTYPMLWVWGASTNVALDFAVNWTYTDV